MIPSLIPSLPTLAPLASRLALPSIAIALLASLLAGPQAVFSAPPPEPARANAEENNAENKAANVPFHDATTAAGLDFSHFNGRAGEYFFPEIMGSGGALLDIDGDGDLDVFLVQGRMFRADQDAAEADPPPAHPLPLTDRLYRNDGPAPGNTGGPPRFTDITAASGLAGPRGATGYGMGAAVGDVDNDGDPDLYITNHGPNQLWRNDGDGTFADVTAASGVGDPRWSTSAVFLDFDRDGWLDLFVTNYVDAQVGNHKLCHTRATVPTYCSPALFAPLPDRLYRNQGDGTFRDVTVETGVDQAFGPGLGVVAADFDGDGWIDLYVANDGQANQLWMNRGGERFEDDALLAGAAVSREGKPEASMGIDAADFDGDGDLDLFMTHLDRETNTLYVNDGSGLFDDRTVEMGLAQPSQRMTGFGTAWLDFDNDGDLDLLVVNGEVDTIDELHRAGDPFPFSQPNQLFENLGGRYREITAEAGEAFEPSEVSRGALFGDLDNDGDTDVVITNNSGPARLLLNRVGGDATWLGLRLVDRHGRDALGAEVTLERAGAPDLHRRVHTDGSYASASDPRVIFGLGDGEAKLRALRVTWPAGTPPGAVEIFPVPATGRYTTLRQGEGRTEAAANEAGGGDPAGDSG